MSSLDDRLELSDVLCHICFGLLIAPVTMPCEHRMCQTCFERNLAVNSLTCPMCKRRIGTWCRQQQRQHRDRAERGRGSSSVAASASAALVDQALWAQIQRDFPERVERRLQGLDETADELDELFPCVATHDHVRPDEGGQIGREFTRQEAALAEERLARQREEEAASLRLIQQLEREEEQASPSLSSSPLTPTSSLSSQPTTSRKSQPVPTSSKSKAPGLMKQKSLDQFLSPTPCHSQQKPTPTSSTSPASIPSTNPGTSESTSSPSPASLHNDDENDPPLVELSAFSAALDDDGKGQEVVDLEQQRLALARIEQMRQDELLAQRLQAATDQSASPVGKRHASSPFSPATPTAKRKAEGRTPMKQLSLQEAMQKRRRTLNNSQ